MKELTEVTCSNCQKTKSFDKEKIDNLKEGGIWIDKGESAWMYIDSLDLKFCSPFCGNLYLIESQK